jgi:hypothetical protein
VRQRAGSSCDERVPRQAAGALLLQHRRHSAASLRKQLHVQRLLLRLHLLLLSAQLLLLSAQLLLLLEVVGEGHVLPPRHVRGWGAQTPRRPLPALQLLQQLHLRMQLLLQELALQEIQLRLRHHDRRRQQGGVRHRGCAQQQHSPRQLLLLLLVTHGRDACCVKHGMRCGGSRLLLPQWHMRLLP